MQARALMHICAVIQDPADLTWGGWTTAGDGTGVKVTVKSKGLRETNDVTEGLLEREIKRDEVSSSPSK